VVHGRDFAAEIAPQAQELLALLIDSQDHSRE
jgi:hypothetical protein